MADEPPVPRIVFDLRWLSGEFIIRYDSHDPAWKPYRDGGSIEQHMGEGYFDWLPPRRENSYLYDLYTYRLCYGGKDIEGTLSNYDFPPGATVYVVRMRTEWPSDPED